MFRWTLRAFASCALPLTLSCSASKTPATGAPAASADAGVVDAGPPAKLALRHFGDFAPFASQIDDFLKVGQRFQPGKFNAAIGELMPFGDRLFLGYGDADYNLGERIPIEMRALTSADEPNVEALAVNGEGQGAPQKTPRQSGEEAIDRYRVIDGELWQAGVDSIDADELWTQERTTPKGIQGNVYRLSGNAFDKHRSVNGGEHVHDLASFGGALYSVGSGADTRTEFEAGQVFRYLWRSSDHGQTFETVKRVQNSEPKNSDTRWVELLATKEKLFVFGYESIFSTNAGKVLNAAFDGRDVVDLASGDPLQGIYAYGTLGLAEGGGLVWGMDVTTQRNTALRVDANGNAQAIAALDGDTVLDVSLTETGELLLLTAVGNPLADAPAHWDVRVLAVDAAAPASATPTELLHFGSDVRPASIAAFHGALFLGTGNGKILRATDH